MFSRKILWRISWIKTQHKFSLIFIIHASNNVPETNLRKIDKNCNFPSNPWIRPNSQWRSKEDAAHIQLIFRYLTLQITYQKWIFKKFSENRHFYKKSRNIAFCLIFILNCHYLDHFDRYHDINMTAKCLRAWQTFKAQCRQPQN